MRFCTGQEDLCRLVFLKTPDGGIRASLGGAPQLGGTKSRCPAEPAAPALPENGCCKRITAPSRELNHNSALTRLHLVQRKGQTGLMLAPRHCVTVTNAPRQPLPTLTSLMGGLQGTTLPPALPWPQICTHHPHRGVDLHPRAQACKSCGHRKEGAELLLLAHVCACKMWPRARQRARGFARV